MVEEYVEDLGDGVKLVLLRILGGKFDMGAEEDDRRIDPVTRTLLPRPEITIADVWMGKYPITQAQWRQVSRWERIQCDLPGDPSEFHLKAGHIGELPVESVTWDEAHEFCRRLAKRKGRFYRLPSEAEWEYASRCRGEGFRWRGERDQVPRINFNGMSMSKAGPVTDLRQKMSWLPQLRTVPVGTGDAANAWGLFDMLGNIWEWCADKWHEDYWNCSSWAEAFDRGEKFHRVARGGAWSSRIESCSAFERARFPVNLCSGDVGLRVAMDPKMQ